MGQKKPLEAAQAAIEKMEAKAQGDYHKPRYHITPRAGWINDPNGLIQFNGTYHAFFQYHPFSPEWGPMHWGHCISDDLVHWRHLPIALYPDEDYETGCFSGSAVDNNGELTLIYTAHHDTGSPKETVCIATSRDGVCFEKYGGNPVIPAPPEGLEQDFRDPKVFRADNRWNMVVGSSKEGKACCCLYHSLDLREWVYQGILCESDGAQGVMWECPDLFEVDGQYLLMVSPMEMKNAKSIVMAGEMDYETGRFCQRNHQEVDYGFEFYAPQTFLDERGRRILIGWMDMWNGRFPTRDYGWAGALTLPRRLSLQDGCLCQQPVEELEQLRMPPQCMGGFSLEPDGENPLDIVKGDCMELNFRLSFPKEEGTLILFIRGSADFAERTELRYCRNTQELIIDKSMSGNGMQDRVVVKVPYKDKLDFRLFLDRSSLEVFVSSGRYTVSNRIYPQRGSVHYYMGTEGGAALISDLEAYPLGCE